MHSSSFLDELQEARSGDSLGRAMRKLPSAKRPMAVFHTVRWGAPSFIQMFIPAYRTAEHTIQAVPIPDSFEKESDFIDR